MASAVEQMAANMNWGAVAKATELKKRILFVLGALIIYRIGTYIPIPGVDPQVWSEIFDQRGGGILDMFNMFSGGALSRMTIFALNIMPYISASIIMQLGSALVPQLEAIKKEGELGRTKINQYTRYLTVFLAAIQAYGLAIGLQNMQGSTGSAVINPGPFFIISTMITIVGGTVFLMWLGEQITQRGIGNGISLIIFAGIVVNLPAAVLATLDQLRTGQIGLIRLLLLLVLMILVIAAVVFIERGQRRVTVQYAKRVVGRRMYGGTSTHIPLKVNTGGVIPVIFASSIIAFPATISAALPAGGWAQSVTDQIRNGMPLYYLLYMAGIIFFAYFYTAIIFNPVDLAENLKKQGAFIPGVKPGARTAEYIDRVLTRVLVPGSIYLAIIAMTPFWIFDIFNIQTFFFGGTGLLIVVGVGLDTVQRAQQHLLLRHYDGFMKKGRVKVRGRQRFG